jgi:hypothetical protein
MTTLFSEIQSLINDYEPNDYIIHGKTKEYITVSYLDMNNNKKKIRFPGASDEEITDLISVSQMASFGINNQTVIDTNYRNASCLKNDRFAIDFDFDFSDIINEISKVFETDVIVKINKLNIYQRYGFFNRHQDTPYKNMLGSLVICLGNKFDGGHLTINNQNMNKEINWGILSDKYNQWCAFYGDLNHYVGTVWDGIRITCTFNIFRKDYKLSYYNIFTSFNDCSIQTPFGKQKLSKTHFIYFCNYLYTSNDTLNYNLKGIDYKIFKKASEYGLDCRLANIFMRKKGYESIEYTIHYYPPPKNSEYNYNDAFYAQLGKENICSICCKNVNRYEQYNSKIIDSNIEPEGENLISLDFSNKNDYYLSKLGYYKDSKNNYYCLNCVPYDKDDIENNLIFTFDYLDPDKYSENGTLLKSIELEDTMYEGEEFTISNDIKDNLYMLNNINYHSYHSISTRYRYFGNDESPDGYCYGSYAMIISSNVTYSQEKENIIKLIMVINMLSKKKILVPLEIIEIIETYLIKAT